MTSQQSISSQTSAPSPASNPNLNPAAKPAPNQATGGTGGFQWGQSGTGSVSMAYGAIMQLMALMTKIQSMNSQQAGTSVQVAGDAAKAAYTQSMAAAAENKKAGMLDAASSFVSGVVAIGGAALSGVSSASTHKQLTPLQKENEQLSGFSEKLTARTTPGASVGTETQRAEPGVEDRINKLKTSSSSGVKKLANDQIDNNNELELNNKAIACMKPKEAKAFGEKLNDAEKINSESTHNVYSQMQTTQQQISMSKEIITSFSTGAITVVKTGENTQAAQDTANAALEQGQSQQLYGMYNNQAQQATQNQGKVLEELQILAQLNQVRG